MIEVLGAIATVGAVIGVVLNNRRLIWCFPLWFCTNAISAVIHLHAGIWSLAVRDIVFMALAVDGWFRWRKP